MIVDIEVEVSLSYNSCYSMVNFCLGIEVVKGSDRAVLLDVLYMKGVRFHNANAMNLVQR